MTQVGGRQWQSPELEAVFANATAHLVTAYEAIDDLSRKSSVRLTSPTFVEACPSLCGTFIVPDDFSHGPWPSSTERQACTDMAS
jgi:hypothetical protein